MNAPLRRLSLRMFKPMAAWSSARLTNFGVIALHAGIIISTISASAPAGNASR